MSFSFGGPRGPHHLKNVTADEPDADDDVDTSDDEEGEDEELDVDEEDGDLDFE